MADQDILIGPGTLYYAPLAEANPDETTIDYGEAWGGNWASLGKFIEGEGVSLSPNEDYLHVYTEQDTSPVAVSRTRREFTLAVSLAEHSPANMALALDGTGAATSAGSSQKGFTSIPFGTQSSVSLYKWGFEAYRKDSSDNLQPVRWFFHRGYLRLSGSTDYRKASPTGVPIEIVLLGDSSQDAGEELGELLIVTAPATA